MCVARYTCEECVEGLNWVQMYMEDPIMIAEFTIYLEQNYCIGNRKPFFGGGSNLRTLDTLDYTMQYKLNSSHHNCQSVLMFCPDEWEYCKEGVVEYFPPMHAMAMEKFFIPTEICNQVGGSFKSCCWFVGFCWIVRFID